MKLRILDRTGHTETDVDAEAMITSLEREMNTRGKVAIAEEPGREPVYLRDAQAARGLSPDAVVTVMPQLRGGA